MKKVDFFVVGAMKAATTSLFKTLDNFDEISCGLKKETDYFTSSKNKRITVEEYHKNFDVTCSIWGECAPNYGKRHTHPGVAQRIYDYNPKAKIIFIRRNPIKRSLSELKMYFEKGEISHDSKIHWLKNRRSKNWKRKNLETDYAFRFGDFESNPIIQNSRYEYQLQPYRDLFGESLLIMDFEKLTSSSCSDCFSQLFEFLNVSPINNIHLSKTHESTKRPIPSNFALFLREKSNYLNYEKLMHRLPALRGLFLRIGFLKESQKVWFSRSLLSDLELFFSDPKNK